MKATVAVLSGVLFYGFPLSFVGGAGLPEAGAQQAQAQPLPALEQPLGERARRGVVAIERGGVRVGEGTVLGGDGRILTALSALGGGDGAEIRYGDGTTAHAKLGASDRLLDVALLAPATARGEDGLPASETDPRSATLVAVLPSKGGGLAPSPAEVKEQVDARTKSGELLPPLLDVAVQGPPVAGMPLLDGSAAVAAILVHACKGGGDRPRQPCDPILLALPVTAVRSFLASTEHPLQQAGPWLGVRADTQATGNVRGVRVTAVAHPSPAEKAGLSVGDIIVAADNKALDGPKALSDAIARHAPGDRVVLLVFGAGAFREAPIELVPAP